VCALIIPTILLLLLFLWIAGGVSFVRREKDILDTKFKIFIFFVCGLFFILGETMIQLFFNNKNPFKKGRKL